MKLAYIFIFALTATSCQAQNNEFFDAADAVFSTYVKDGKINYAAIKKDPKKLGRAMELAAQFKPDVNNPEIYQAFWIDVYNLSVFKEVVDNYPISSPQDVNGFFDTTTFSIAGENLTLNDMENKKLREKFPDEARFHFVLVCAGLGCPPIINEAYRPETLDKQMQQQTEAALNDPVFTKVNGNNVALTEIFKWYKEDFDRQGGAVTFINKYRKDKLPENVSVSYYDYDWKLNGVE